jgi:hypothetical protein
MNNLSQHDIIKQSMRAAILSKQGSVIFKKLLNFRYAYEFNVKKNHFNQFFWGWLKLARCGKWCIRFGAGH